MSCIKHHDKILSYCQSCAIFLCSKCPQHHNHSTIAYNFYISESKFEIESINKQFQSKQKLLEMLEIKIQGYFSSISQSKQSAIASINSFTELLHTRLNEHKGALLGKIESLVESFTKPLLVYTDRIQGYLLEINRQINTSEELITSLSGPGPQDPILILNDKSKLNASEIPYIDMFISTCRKTLEAKLPVLPNVENNPTALESCLFLDLHSKFSEPKQIFPYWCLDRLLASLKIKDHGFTVSSKTDGWATAIFQDSFSSGKGIVEFLISNDASGSKMYIGVINSNSPGMNLAKAFSSTSGYLLWAYRICGEMHAKGFVYSKLKDQRRFRRGDKIRIEVDMERAVLTFYKNSEEMYTFVDISESVRAFVCFGEAFQSVKIIHCENDTPKVIFH